MEQNNVIEKHKTGIYGLDQLFFGGIQLRLANSAHDYIKTEGMIIAIKGNRVCYKTMLAMHLMHGLTKSLILRNSNFFKSKVPKFYSLDEPEGELYDQYLDLLITRQIEKMIRETISGKTEEDDSQISSMPVKDLWENNILAKALFRVENGEEFKGTPSSPKLPFNFQNKLDVMMFERAIYYNTRTNALHFKVNSDNDSHHNILYFRRSNVMDDYLGNSSFRNLPDRFINDFVNAKFIGREGKEKVSGYPNTSTIRFQNIIDDIERSRHEEKSSSYLAPCVVIDGLSDICDQNLRTLPFTHISKALRQFAPVSILVFDDRYENVNLDADIVIEMRNNDDNDEKYSFNELRIAKSSFQTVAYGWHQYKKRDTGIEVFPSLHRVLQIRDYLTRISTFTHRGVFEESFSEYNERSASSYDYDAYLNQRVSHSMVSLRELYCHEAVNPQGSEEQMFNDACNYLKDTLFAGVEERKKNIKIQSYVTAVIGNPNSFKRHVAMARTFSLSLKGEHSLVVLFDKDSDNMKRMMRCSGYHAQNGLRLDKCPPKEVCCDCSSKCDFIKNCMNCYNNIHFLSLRMGCITAEEILFVLDQQIELSFRDGKRIKHIFIEDLQKIDYSFPFLKSNKLFLSALVTFCREKKVELTILCDKNAGLTQELCTLADNVICMEREIENTNRFATIRIERSAIPHEICKIMKYEIKDMLSLFKCDVKSNSFTVSQSKDVISGFSEIGSMKGYWRKTIHTVEKNS